MEKAYVGCAVCVHIVKYSSKAAEPFVNYYKHSGDSYKNTHLCVTYVARYKDQIPIFSWNWFSFVVRSTWNEREEEETLSHWYIWLPFYVPLSHPPWPPMALSYFDCSLSKKKMLRDFMYLVASSILHSFFLFSSLSFSLSFFLSFFLSIRPRGPAIVSASYVTNYKLSSFGNTRGQKRMYLKIKN